MGKEWYYWGGSSGRSSSKRRGGASASAETEIPPPSSVGGCMCAVFQAFDFHPFHFFMNHHQQQQPQPQPHTHTHKSASCNSQQDLHDRVPKGAEAPRNSLESEDGTTSSSISKEDNLKVPKNIRIKTSGGTRGRNLSDVSSEISISPGTKTPTLVARLMGLDLLPDAANSSSSSSSSSLSTPKRQCNPQHHHHNHLKPRQQQHRQHIQITRHRNSTDCITNVRSLPETPRMSLARRSDAEHHRLSLQINKENMVFGEELDPPRFSFSKRKYDENNSSSIRSPSHYATQMVKQVKDSVSRKVGLDITNTLKNKYQTLSKDELVAQFRFKKSPKKSVDEPSPGKHSNPSSYSPRLSRFVDTRHKPSTKNPSSPSPSPLTPKDQNTKPASPPPLVNIGTQLRSRVLSKPQALHGKELQSQQKPVAPKCKRVTTNERFSSRHNSKPPRSSVRNKQDESFIARASDMKTKSKRTHPISSNLLPNGINAAPNPLPVKTDPSPPATKIPQKQVSYAQEPNRIAQLSSCSRHKYKQEPPHTLATATADEGPVFQYIAAILSRTGLRKATLQNLQFQWFSLSHPLDPSIFHNLEHYHPVPITDSSVSSHGNEKDCTFAKKNQLGLRCNRRLLFDLVDELLSEILARRRRHCAGSMLEEVLWKRVRSFRGAKCEVLEDIDGLIEMEDVKEEEEGEGLVAEIGRSIVEALVHETVTVMVGGGGGPSSMASFRMRRRHGTEGVTWDGRGLLFT